MHTQTATLRPANDIQLVAVENVTLQGPVELVEIKARLQIKFAIKRIHRKRITVVLIGWIRSDIPANHFFACFLGTGQAAVRTLNEGRIRRYGWRFSGIKGSIRAHPQAAQ